MLPNIVEHSLQVMRVSLAVTDHLKDGVSINRELVTAAALLHDITKTRSLKTKENHAASGGVLLRKLGFASIAEIVEQHVIIHNLNLEGKIEEKEIVYYADKRVMHDTIVCLEERVLDLIKRYGTTEEIRNQIIRNWEQVIVVEQRIADVMKIDIHHAIQTIV
jgi:putative nucleotidyltransferase with HDIG domain